MNARVKDIAEQIKSLTGPEMEEFLAWLMDYELEREDEWDRELEQDSQPGGRLESILDRVRRDIAAGKSKPLDEVLRDS